MKTSVIVLVLSLVAATALVTASEAPFVERHVLVGDWAYQGYDSQGSLTVTGRMTFITATTPLVGNWEFQPVHVPHVSGHYVGQETFIDGELSRQRVTVRKVMAIDNEFVLSGQMGVDEYSGVWQRNVEGPPEVGSFMARRIPH